MVDKTTTAPERDTYQSPFGQEMAPSDLRDERTNFPRMVGMAGLGLVFVGAAVLFFNTLGPRWIGPATGQGLVLVGVALMLFHAARDSDVQIRRTYGLLGGFLPAGLAIVLSLLPVKGAVGALFFPWGALGLLVGLFFLLPFARSEDDPRWHRGVVVALTAVGALLAAVGFIGGFWSVNFLLPYGLTLAVMGLLYLWAAVAQVGTNSDGGYRLAVIVGAAGAIVILVAIGRSAAPLLVSGLGRFFVPSGLLLLSLGLLYVLLAVGLYSERQVVVLTRRELASYFYSPIAYLVLFGMALICWINYLVFVNGLVSSAFQGQPQSEPIVRGYIVSFIPVFGVMFAVPAITMRLMSEERRTGTLEVLLTTALSETTVVLSKFLAGLVFFLFICLPLGGFLLALRIESGRPFDYLPLLSFYIALICSGAAFVSMGLFFSALTRNQIVAAVLTFMGMVFLVALIWLRTSQIGATTATVMKQFSFVDLWIDSLGGKLYVRDIVLQLSVAAFWLFLTARVLEARKWS